MRKVLLLSATLLLVVGLAAATGTGTVRGTVVDSDGVPVDGARVSLHAEDGTCWAYLYTEGDGAFVFDDVPVGSYLLVAAKKHVGSASEDVTVTDGGIAVFDLVLMGGAHAGQGHRP